jgi:hypothetical protein
MCNNGRYNNNNIYKINWKCFTMLSSVEMFTILPPNYDVNCIKNIWIKKKEIVYLIQIFLALTQKFNFVE